MRGTTNPTKESMAMPAMTEPAPSNALRRESRVLRNGIAVGDSPGCYFIGAPDIRHACRLSQVQSNSSMAANLDGSDVRGERSPMPANSDTGKSSCR